MRPEGQFFLGYAASVFGVLPLQKLAPPIVSGGGLLLLHCIAHRRTAMMVLIAEAKDITKLFPINNDANKVYWSF